jgi:hypothetical protein
VEVVAPFAVAEHVHQAYAFDAADRALDAADENAELGGELLGQVARRRIVRARLEEDDDRQAARLVERAQPPAFVRPDVGIVRQRAGSAVDASLAVARPLSLHRRLQRLRLDGPVERPRLPLGDRRRLQLVVRSFPELLRRLGHGHRG